jgi:hypothetical protein
MLKSTNTVAFGASPFRPRSMGLYPVGHQPIRSKGAYSSRQGPERNRNVSLSAASVAPAPRLGGLRGEKSRGDAKAGARDATVSKSRDMAGSHRDWRFKDSGYATLSGSNGERLEESCVIAPERQRPLCRLEERSGFSDENALNNPG